MKDAEIELFLADILDSEASDVVETALS